MPALKDQLSLIRVYERNEKLLMRNYLDKTLEKLFFLFLHINQLINEYCKNNYNTNLQNRIRSMPFLLSLF